MRMPYPLLAAALVALIISAPGRGSAAEPDTRADVTAALGMRAEVRAHALACEQQTGSYGWLFRWSEHFWEGGNLGALRYADQYAASLTPDDRRTLQDGVDAFAARARAAREATDRATPGADALSGCEDLLRQLQGHEHRQDLLGRDVAQRLANAYATARGGAEAARIDQRHEDMVIGCMKNALKQGQRDIAVTRSTCECVITAVESAATPADIDAYNAATAGPGGGSAAAQAQLLNQPWMQAAIPKIKACSDKGR
jgi:hypothetical protein